MTDYIKYRVKFANLQPTLINFEFPKSTHIN